MDPVKAEAFLVRQSAMKDEDRDIYHAFAIVHRESGRVIGDVGMYLPSGSERVGDLGFQFDPDHQGKGYAIEASKAVVEFGFTTLGLTRITSSCRADNARSYGLMKRLGMSPVDSKGVTDSVSYELVYEVWLNGRISS